MAASAQILPFPTQGPADPTSQPTGRETDPSSRFLPVTKLKRQYLDYISSKHGENEEAQEADRYFHAAQWTDEERNVLKDRRQPEVTFNRIKRKTNIIVGIIEKARQDPKAYPRNPDPAAEDGSEICTKALRYALGWDWQDKSAEVARRAAIRGIWGVELVLVPAENGDMDIELDEVDQRDFFYDPRSGKRDFSDARFMGTARWIDREEAELQWPDSQEAFAMLRETAPANWDKADTRNLHWYNRQEDQVRIVDHWYKRGGEWLYTIYCGDIMLEEGESPFRDHRKQSIAKYIMMSCEVDHDNDRYGFFRDWKGPQDEINHRRSKALHILNNRQVIADAGAVDDVDLARREAARSDGWIIRNPGLNLEFVDKSQDIQGNLEMLQEAKAEIDTYGPNPGLIGTDIPAESGRAIQLLQAAGIAELGTFMLTYKHWKLRVYRAVWCAIQQFWTAERWVRVTDDEGMAQFIQVNGWQQDEYGFPVIINQLSQMDVDIILDEGPDTINTMADTFDTLVQVAQRGAQIPPAVFIELSALPSSTKKRVMQMLQAAEEPNPMDLQALQLKLQDVLATIQTKQAKATLDHAKAQQIAATPPDAGGPAAQVDTPADLAKAALDIAKAQEIVHRMQQPREQPQAGLFDVEEQAARVRRENAAADETAVRAANLARYGAAEPGRIRPQGVQV